jgi:malate dehydrogenase (oxaloacetate-decarboxylating)(NADP+)
MTKNSFKNINLIRNPALNKGLAFTKKERQQLKLNGLLPPHSATQEEQTARIIENFNSKQSDLEKYIYLTNLKNTDETLFYRTVIDNIKKMMPIIYTPTVGQACQEYSKIFTPQGMFISIKDKGQIANTLKNWPNKNVKIIVVTDGERILGLGDLGANGMGIPVGKLSLYTACAGIHPEHCLPITLDVGTENEKFLNDMFYIGLKQRRIRGKAYDNFIEEFILAVKKVFPKALIQFEDFANTNAFRLLHKYRDKVCTFNDDIQGTASVALAGLYSSLKITKAKLSEQKILFLGAGEAGIGIGDLIVSAMQAEGIPEKEARKKCLFVDSRGLVVKSRTDLTSHKIPYAHDFGFVPDLLSAIKTHRPTALIGVSGQPRTFTHQIIEEMAKINKRPIIFALSNPTSKAECTAEEAYTYTNGNVIFASGSPFAPVTINGKTYIPGQGNNAYIFPGVGLGVIASGAKIVTDEMFFMAAKTLADLVSDEDLNNSSIYPPLTKIRYASKEIAIAVTNIAYKRKLATKPKPKNIEKYIDSQMYNP